MIYGVTSTITILQGVDFEYTHVKEWSSILFYYFLLFYEPDMDVKLWQLPFWHKWNDNMLLHINLN